MFSNNYFKGWYFKCSTKDITISFIPAFHRINGSSSRNGTAASLQIIMDDAAFNIPFDSLEYQEKPLSIRLGDSVFSEKGIKLNIHSDEFTAEGTIRFHFLSPVRYDIMGPFKYLPFMQCKHSVYSVNHQINGHITINEQVFHFQNGVGYIEGDCGHSFPNQYIWTQCNFEGNSLMLSIADIPLFGLSFTGIIGFVWLDGKEYRIATYLGARLEYIEEDTFIVKQGNYRLTAKLLEKNAQPLFAPNNGIMSRTVHESASCKAYYCFSIKEKILCEFTSDRASFEFELQ